MDKPNPSESSGRLVGATTTASGSVNTALVYSYDPMGRPLNFWQCNAANCSSLWNTQYNYDKAGDVTSWTHPAGYTLTNTVNPAQQVTAVAKLLAGLEPSPVSGPEHHLHRLGRGQPARERLRGQRLHKHPGDLHLQQPAPALDDRVGEATGTNAYADYCLVYNYFSSWTAPSSCPSPTSVPTSGSGNNGNVMGYWYQDNVNSSYSHTASYGYDTVNRLAHGGGVQGTPPTTSPSTTTLTAT